MLNLTLGGGVEATFIVEDVSTQSSTRPGRPSTGVVLEGPSGSRLELDEEQISHIQPDGPQEGTDLYISLDNGASLTLSRPREMENTTEPELRGT